MSVHSGFDVIGPFELGMISVSLMFEGKVRVSENRSEMIGSVPRSRAAFISSMDI